MNINLIPPSEKEFRINNNNLKDKIKELNDLFLNETYKGNKVAFYYGNSDNQISFNDEICFYAASTIKILVSLYLFEKACNKEIDLNKKILVTMSDIKQDTGIIKYQKEDTEYTILELIKLNITESDNTAYLKLVDIIGGKEKLREYGLSLGATNTMEGKSTDSFGIVNIKDMLIYWKKVKEFIDDNNEYSTTFKDYLLNPSVKLIKDESINNKNFIRKYGSWDIAYHETGYIESKKTYYMIILTQINKEPYKEEFINKAAKLITEINNIIEGN